VAHSSRGPAAQALAAGRHGVVLRQRLNAAEQELGAFLARLAAFKTPRKILFLAESQRISRKKLGLG
jgi:hypothetical protein